MRAVWSFAVVATAVCCVVSIPEAGAQDVVDLYRARRMNSRATIQSYFRLEGQPLAPLQLAEIPYRPTPGVVESTVEPEVTVPVYHVRRVPRFARTWFEDQFATVEWAYDGGNTLAPLDTMLTREVRARLEHAFGAPTRTLADDGPLNKLDLSEYVQFEYWFLVNGEWPIIIMDVNGPFERGVVVSGQAAHREQLIAIRDAVLAPILESDAKAPFADYFFETEVNEWYITGFDGRSFFFRPINPRSVNPGRPARPSPPTDSDSGVD